MYIHINAIITDDVHDKLLSVRSTFRQTFGFLRIKTRRKADIRVPQAINPPKMHRKRWPN